MDALSVTASIITVVQLAKSVTVLCFDAASKLKSVRKDIHHIVEEIISLRTVLEGLNRLVSNDSNPLSANRANFETVASAIAPLARCRIELQGIESELGKLIKSKSGPTSWIFKEKDIMARLDRISAVKHTLQLALVVDQTSAILETRVQSMSLKSSIDETNAESKRRAIIEWLSPSFHSNKLNDTQKIRTPTTGNWFLHSDLFKDWRQSPGSIMRLTGIPGSGKTVLCSSIIEELTEWRAERKDIIICHYFFDFAAQESQTVGAFVRSLLALIVVQGLVIPGAISNMYQRHHDGFQPPNDHNLLKMLHSLLKEVSETYVVVDALDECKELTHLLEAFDEIGAWHLPNVHILATCREDREIEETFTGLHSTHVSLDEAVLEDVHLYVNAALKKDRRLKRWPTKVQADISAALMRQAGCMFRLAKCQVDIIKTCFTLSELQKAMSSLPNTLDETYARILNNIEPALANDAFRILS
ncbi:hypothetical protein EJ04DRAFT_588089 [Polyplosphaeria fusca]|uniref:NACHT domain-containing protein n=1 Tax=Polyplosphaeria fusca TaxID=682080 RepID=A0A9P4V6B2_9PLEO|nr:hypothetical protein EJ04DRAFT_588089 [Polyplosphaeria fusca]